MSIYDIDVTLENGEVYSLERYRGKVLLIVNTATNCGLATQFDEMQELYEKYKSQGLVVLGFPSNQFKQELGSAKDAAEACKTTYGVDFPMHEIIKVNGDSAHPLFKYLKDQADGTFSDAIKWNFTKFLVDKEGNVADRFAPTSSPSSFEDKITAIL